MTNNSELQAKASRTDALIIFGYRVVGRIMKVVPPAAIAVATSIVVPVVCVFMRKQRPIVARNLRRVNPELRGFKLRRAVSKSYQSYARYFVETFRLPTLSKEIINSKISVTGFEHIENGLNLGKGVILALPHLGGWEWSGRWLIDQGHNLNAVVEKLDSQGLFQIFVDLRKSYGVNVIPLDDKAGVAVQEALARNEIVALLSDRDLQGNGIEVEFFGERTTVPAGPAFFALRTGATLLSLGTYFAKGFDQHETVVRPAVNIQRTGSLRDDMKIVAQDLVREFEILIREKPEQWHLFQPNWPSDKIAETC
ncbi:MAG: phosphatidylinositol mannoside acyltransferase [Ilumatobacteraceae bacterium]|nr:phosphatidylinositol mannoside acyltransferase [Ilumatobacteraceae bacterium]